MATYAVSYDLVSPGKDYKPLHEYLKAQANWWHHLGSSWVIVTTLTAAQLRDGIKEHVDANDKVLVTKCASEGAWTGFNKSASDWLLENL
jgi:hypothetical protein